MKPEYTLTKVINHVYHAHFQDPYQLAMHFLRAQEYYESPRFADKLFSLVDYMEWYISTAKEPTRSFTYADDWSGFNVPSWVLHAIYFRSEVIPDPNKYDTFMHDLFFNLLYKEQGHNFYLIGTSAAGWKGDGDVEGMLDHELAHAMYYVDHEYKLEVDKLLDAFPLRQQFTDTIAANGYHPRTVQDEINAYLATGSVPFLENVWNEELSKPFQANFLLFKQKNSTS